MFGGRVLQQTVDIPMGTNCAPLLADLFINEAYFIHWLPNKNETKLTRSINFIFRYLDEVLSLNYSKFGDFVDRIYPIELEIKDTTDTTRSPSYLDLHLEIDREDRLRTNLYDKGMISILPLWIFHLYVATFQQHLHMEYIFLLLIRYYRAFESFLDFLDRGLQVITNMADDRLCKVIFNMLRNSENTYFKNLFIDLGLDHYVQSAIYIEVFIALYSQSVRQSEFGKVLSKNSLSMYKNSRVSMGKQLYLSEDFNFEASRLKLCQNKLIKHKCYPI